MSISILVGSTRRLIADQREAPGTPRRSLLRKGFDRAVRNLDRRPTGGAQSPSQSHRRFALLPSALFVELLLRCQLGVLNWKRVLPSRTRTDTLLFREAVPRRRRSHPNSAIWFSSFKLRPFSAAAVDFDFATARTPHRLPTTGEVGCPAFAQQPQPLSSSHACRLVRPGVAPIVSDQYRVRDG